MRASLSFLILFLFLSILTFSQEKIDNNFKYNGFFEENLGQYKSAEDFKILFVSHSSNMTLFITDKGLSYILYDNSNSNEIQGTKDSNRVNVKSPIEAYRIDMLLKGADIQLDYTLKRVVKNLGVKNYYFSHCSEGALGVKSYDRIEFKEVYKGIDWHLFFDDELGLKYEFIIHPQADVNQIKMLWQYVNNDDISIADNKITVSSPVGSIKEGQLLCLQNDKEVNSKYIKDKNEISIDLEDYIVSDTLVIDPQIVWSTYIGVDYDITVVDTDSHNNIYSMGYLSFIDLFNTPWGNIPEMDLGGGAYYQLAVTEFDIGGIQKFTPEGDLLWSTYYGGGSYPEVSRIMSGVIDNSDRLIVAGWADHAGLPLYNPGGSAYYQNYGGGEWDAFIACFNVLGILEWATYYGGNAHDDIDDIAINSQNEIVITGSTNSMDLNVISQGGYVQNHNLDGSWGVTDVYISKFSENFELNWSTYLAGSGSEYPSAIAIDGHDNIIILSTCFSDDYPVLDYGNGAYFQSTFSSNLGAVVISKFDENTNMLWSTYFSGGGYGMHSSPRDVICNSQNEIYITGTTNNANFPIMDDGVGYFNDVYNLNMNVASPPCQPGSTPEISTDLFLTQFSDQNILEWSTFLGSEGLDEYRAFGSTGCDLSIDQYDNIFSYSTAGCQVGNFPVFAPDCWFLQDLVPTNYGYYHSRLLMFNKNNEMIWSTYYSTDQITTFGGAICNDSRGDIIFSTRGMTHGYYALPIIGSSTSYQQFNPSANSGIETSHITKMLNFYIQEGVDTLLICEGDSVIIGTSYYSNPGFSVFWQPNGEITDSIIVSEEGIYVAEITYSDTCVMLDSFYIDTYNCLVDVSDVDICNGDTTEISANANFGVEPYSFVWNSGLFYGAGPHEVFPTLTTDYIVSVTDANGESMIDTATVTVLEPDIIINSEIHALSCYENQSGAIDLTILGGTETYTFQWSNGSTSEDLQTLSAGTYEVTVTDSNACVLSQSFLVNQPPEIALSLTASDLLCYEDSNAVIYSTVSGGQAPYTYLWSTGSGNEMLSNLPSGLYTLSLTDVNDCLQIDSVFVVSSIPPLSLSINKTDILCYGGVDGQIQVEASGATPPYNYQWSNGSQSSSIELLSFGDYIITITDANNCTLIDTIRIDQPSELAIDMRDNFFMCENPDELIESSVTGGLHPYSYEWNTGVYSPHITVSPEETTVYTLSVLDSNQCLKTKSIEVGVYPSLELYLVANRDTVCPGGAVILSADITGGSGAPYRLKIDGQTDVSPIEVHPFDGQIYHFTAEDQCGQTTNTSYTLYNYFKPEAHFISEKSHGCQPLEVQFRPSYLCDGCTYLWDFGNIQTVNTSTEQKATHVFLDDGQYDVSLNVTNIYGCEDYQMQRKLITVYPKPEAFFTTDPEIASILKPVIQFYNQTEGAEHYQWFFGDGLASTQVDPSHRYDQAGEYKVELVGVTNHNCRDTVYGMITIKDEFTFYAPTAFTPDGDGVNDAFKIFGHGISSEGFSLRIYNRWGEPIFESSDMDAIWDGRTAPSNTVAQNGAYVWHCILKDYSGKLHEFSGSVNLIK